VQTEGPRGDGIQPEREGMRSGRNLVFGAARLESWLCADSVGTEGWGEGCARADLKAEDNICLYGVMSVMWHCMVGDANRRQNGWLPPRGDGM